MEFKVVCYKNYEYFRKGYSYMAILSRYTSLDDENSYLVYRENDNYTMFISEILFKQHFYDIQQIRDIKINIIDESI